ncbi:MAG: beta-N-acetylhexosaminidase [Deltaproteobacteria bacterium]|nr:beta-N-acetylhexosaminidase [Deltaproteobacteria bacterium]
MQHDDVGQLLWVGFHGTEAPAPLVERLAAGAYGATILFKRNLTFATSGGVETCDLDALVALTRQLHRAPPDGTPALIAVDQEGGLVQRVRAPATLWPPMRAHDGLPAGADEGVAHDVGLAMGRELHALGFDIDFAPVLDVHTNPANPIIGDRAFGTEAEVAARRALAFARGLAGAGMLACGKHFPGHGDTSTDSHLELPRIDHAWERLERVELLPFARAAAAKLPMIMTAHVVFGALDATVPATLSRAVITGLLREKLGYEGVIVSDDLDMKAIADHVGVEAAAVAAIRAGCDVLLLCRDEAHQVAAEAALRREAERDEELRRRIGESAARVRAMKRAHAEHRAAHPAPARAIVGSSDHRQLAERLAGRA